MEYNIKQLFDIQDEQNNYWYDSELFRVDPEYRMNVVKDYVLGMHEQVSALMNTLDWKKHLIVSSENKYNTKMQAIDIIKYALGIMIFEGVSVDEFFTLFKIKSKLLDERWRQQNFEITKNTEVAIFDIDGCIADYPSGYEKFLEQDKGLKRVSVVRHSYYFCDRYGITKELEEKFHSEFIESGGFLGLDVFVGSLNVIRKVKKSGIKVVLLTARPSWIHKRVYTDTYNWLQDIGCPYDLLLWDKDKADATIKNIFPANILFMIEDRDKHAIEMAHIDVPVWLLDKEYNKGVMNTKNVERVKNWVEIEKKVDQILNERNENE